MVGETRLPGASVSRVARRHDLNANLLFKWRRQVDAGVLVLPDEALDFLPIGMVGSGHDGRPLLVAPSLETEADRTQPAEPSAVRSGLMEIDLPEGVRIRADATVDERALGRVLSALKRHR